MYFFTDRTSRAGLNVPRTPLPRPYETPALKTLSAYGATAAVSAARPRAALPRLYSSKPPTAGGTDFVDSLAGEPREMSNEERIAALQREIAAQVG